MGRCSVTKNLRIVRGGFEDYKRLARFHYRDSRPGAYTAIYAIKHRSNMATEDSNIFSHRGHREHRDKKGTRISGSRKGCLTAYQGEGHQDNRGTGEPVGVIVYSMPSAGAELRNVATGNLFTGFDNRTRMGLINKNIRCISRVIIEPRYRGLGLASRLVRETMPEMGMPIIEAMAVMGMVNPFFEKAGMKSYAAKKPGRCVRLTEAFSAVGIGKEELVDAEAVRERMGGLGQAEGEFIEFEIRLFLQSYGKKRYEGTSLKGIRFVLSKLTFRPVYYIWFNEKARIKV